MGWRELYCLRGLGCKGSVCSGVGSEGGFFFFFSF